MRYSVEREGEQIVVSVEGAEGREATLLDAVRNCPKATRLDCAVECGKIAAFEQQTRGAALVLRLLPRAGERLDRGTVDRCLRILWGQTDH